MWLLYGANGTTGRLLLEVWQAHFSDLPKPLIAGRNAIAVRALGEKYGLEWAAFPLENLGKQSLNGIQLVVNLAGPYQETARPWVEACLHAGVAYMDICGEWRTFQWMYSLPSVSVPLITAAGYDTVVGEGALYFLRKAFPQSKRLKLGIYARGGFSAGTVKSALGMLTEGYYIWQQGALLPVPFQTTRWQVSQDKAYEFAIGTLAELITFPAWNPDIESLSAWVALPKRYWRWRPLLERVFVWKPFLSGMQRLLDAQRGQLAQKMDKTARSLVIAQSEYGEVRVRSPQPYVLTAWTTLASVRLFFSVGAEKGVASAFARWRERLWACLPEMEVSYAEVSPSDRLIDCP